MPLAVFCAYKGGWWLGAPLAVVTLMTSVEYFQLVARAGARPLAVAGSAVSVGMVLLSAQTPVYASWVEGAGALIVALTLCSGIALALGDRHRSRPLLSMGACVAGAVLTGGTLSFALLLRHLPDPSLHRWTGPLVVLFPMAVTWIGDTVAYFVGRSWGKRPLAPDFSPKKTVEGALGALAAQVLTGCVLGWLLQRLGLPAMNPWIGGVIGVVLGAVAQAGDLVESILKRDAGVKDSGIVFLGHGGALDRFDGLFFSWPLAYAIFGLFPW